MNISFRLASSTMNFLIVYIHREQSYKLSLKFESELMKKINKSKLVMFVLVCARESHIYDGNMYKSGKNVHGGCLN